MATITPVHIQQGRGAHLFTWAMTDDDEGKPISIPAASDRSVHNVGTWGGATVVMQGSNEVTPTVWFELNAVQDFTTAISSTADATPGIQQIGENSVWIRPVSSGGTGTSVTVNLLVRNGT